MSPTTYFILRSALNALALFILPGLISGLQIDSYPSALFAAILLGLINALIRPFLILITLPITVLTLGIFTLIINALLFWFVTWLVPGIQIGSFWTAFWSAFCYSILTSLVSLALGPPAQIRIRH